MMANFMSFLASTTLNLDLCSDFMEVVVRQASFRSLISQICLLFFTMPFRSIQILHFASARDRSEAGNYSHFRIPLSSAEVVMAV